MKPMLGPRGHVRHLGKVCFGMLITKSPLHRIEQGDWFASIIIFNTFYVLVPPPLTGSPCATLSKARCYSTRFCFSTCVPFPRHS